MLNTQTLFKSGVTQAILWCVVVVGFAVASLIGLTTGALGATMTGLIVLFGIAGIALAFRFLSRVDQQRRQCEEDSVKMLQLPPQKLLQLQITHDSSWFRVIAVRAHCCKTEGNPLNSHEALLSPYISRLKEELSLLAAMAKLLPLAGLLGTVAGMALSLGSISSGLQKAGDLEAISSSLKETLSGMGLAFNTTLVAIVLGGVILSPLVNVAKNRVEELLGLLRERLAQLSSITEQEPNLSRNAGQKEVK